MRRLHGLGLRWSDMSMTLSYDMDDIPCLQFHTVEPAHDKTYKMACASSEDSDQPRQPSSLIRVFAARMMKACVLSYPLSAQQSL